jgi:hypothetical protein
VRRNLFDGLNSPASTHDSSNVYMQLLTMERVTSG